MKIILKASQNKKIIPNNQLNDSQNLTEAEQSKLNIKNIPDYLTGIAKRINTNFSKEKLSKISTDLDKVKNRTAIAKKIQAANKDLLTNYLKADQNDTQTLRALIQAYIKVIDGINNNSIKELTNLIENLKKEKLTEKNLVELKNNNGKLLKTNIINKVNNALTADLAFSLTNNVNNSLTLINNNKNLLQKVQDNTDLFITLATDLKTVADTISANKNANANNIWEIRINNLAPLLKKLSRSSKINLNQNSLQSLNINLKELLKTIDELSKSNLNKQFKKYADHNTKIAEETPDNSEIDWAELYKKIALEKDKAKAMENFWKQYLTTVWPGKEQQIKNLGPAFVKEVTTLGFSQILNPFLIFINKNLDILNQQNYTAIHNAYVNDYINKDLLVNQEKYPANLINSKALYSKDTSEIINYLKLQAEVLEKFKNKETAFANKADAEKFKTEEDIIKAIFFNNNELNSITKVKENIIKYFKNNQTEKIPDKKLAAKIYHDVCGSNKEQVIEAMKYLSIKYLSNLNIFKNYPKITNLESSTFPLALLNKFNKGFAGYSINEGNIAQLIDDLAALADIK